MTRARTLDTKDLDSPFVWVYRFDGAGAATAVDTFEPLQPGDPGFVWVHLNISDARARVWTQCQTWMAAEVRDLLTGNNEHQRLAGDDRHICGVFADFARELSGTSEDFGHLRFLVTDQLIVSARRHPVQSALATREAIKAGTATPATPFELAELLFEQILEAIQIHCDGLLSDINEIEDHVIEEKVTDERRKLGAQRRKAVRLHRNVNGMQRVVARLERSEKIPPAGRVAMHNIAQRLDSLHHDLHAAQERSRLLQDEIGAQLVTETNRQLYVLTIMSILFMPPTLVTGMFGMNVKGLLFADDENGYIYSMIICLVSALVVWGIVYVTGRRMRSISV